MTVLTQQKAEDLTKDAALLRSLRLKYSDSQTIVATLETVAAILDFRVRELWRVREQEVREDDN